MVVLVIRRIVLTLDVMTEDISLDIIDMVIGTETLVDMAVVLLIVDMATLEIITMVKTNLLLIIVTIKGGLSINNHIIVKPVAVVT